MEPELGTKLEKKLSARNGQFGSLQTNTLRVFVALMLGQSLPSLNNALTVLRLGSGGIAINRDGGEPFIYFERDGVGVAQIRATATPSFKITDVTGGTVWAEFSGALASFPFAATITGLLTCGGGIALSQTTNDITTTTADGSDTAGVRVTGGGAIGFNRGSFISVFGNEHASNPGRVLVAATTSGSAVGYIYFQVGGSNTVFQIDVDRVTASYPFILKGYTVAGLPAGTVGMNAYATDLLAPAYGAVAVGGGAVTLRVFYNGAAWVVD